MYTPLQVDDNAPWKQRYRAPVIHVTQIAPHTPMRGLVGGTQSGTMQFYAWDVPTGNLRQLTDKPGGMASFVFLAPDGRYAYYLDDQQGNELGHYVRLPYEGGAAQDITPDMPPYSSFGFAHSRAGNRLGFMAAYADGFHIYCMDVGLDGALGARREIYHSPKLTFGPAFSGDGTVAVVMSSERMNGPQFSLIAFDTVTGERLGELWDGEEYGLEVMAASPTMGDARFLATTNRTGTETLLIWNPRTGERTDLVFEGITGAVRAFDWSPDGTQIVFRTFNNAEQQLYLHHLPSGQTRPLQYPPGTNFSPYFTPDGAEIISHWQDATHPTQVIALDPASGAMTRTVLKAGDVPPGHSWKSISFPSSDGQMIQGWLGLPDGDGPFPTILETHGGPEAVQGNNFSPGAQAWLDHGIAFLTINYRGSVTFGREFQEKIWGQPGHWEIEDLAAARHWLVQENIARPDAILLTGWSYGGYLTLLGLGRRPELWAGGMAGIAIADWTISYEDSAETMKGYQAALFGGTPHDKPEQYKISSPITYAENVAAPVIIIQGRNDTRTPARPVEMYEAKMKALGKTIEVHWYDTGHAGSFTSIEEGIKHQEWMMRFAYRVLG